MSGFVFTLAAGCCVILWGNNSDRQSKSACFFATHGLLVRESDNNTETMLYATRHTVLSRRSLVAKTSTNQRIEGGLRNGYVI